MSQPGAQRIPQISLSNSILSGGNFIQNNQTYTVRNGERAGYARLSENVATAALHDSIHVVDPPKCHPNTRTTIIQTVIDWASSATLDEEVNHKPILWLKGGAGAGKSAIARSVAERGSKEGVLLGTFFFRTDDATRNHVGSLVATLAYQVCRGIPQLREIVTSLIEDDPLVFSRSVSTQFTDLIIGPLSTILSKHSGTTQIPHLIIIDGLDECSANIDSQQDLLFTLQEVITSTVTPIRFLLCSRPESHLNNAFSSSRMANIHYRIFLDDDYSAHEDIKLYLEDKFREIKEGHVFKHKLPTTWPSPDIMCDLAYKSSGQFIYASTVVQYVKSPRHKPDQRLDAALNLRPPFKDLPFTELDALYRHIISKAEDPSKVLDILAFPVLYGDFNVADLERILQLEEGDMEVKLADLQSLVTIGSSWGVVKVKFLHKSFQDFLCDSQRAGDLYQDLSAVQIQHAVCSISAVSTTFEDGGIRALGDDMAPWLLSAGDLLGPTRLELRGINFNGEKTISSDFLQAALQFPLFNLIKQMHTDPARHESGYAYLREFLSRYLWYLRSLKDVRECSWLIYLQQVWQYCEAVLSLLEDDFSNDWKAHFIYAYYHLLGPRLCRYSPFTESLHVQQLLPWEGGTFEDFIYYISSSAEVVPGSLSLDNYLCDILEISNDMTKGTKREATFALSASFCLSFLCDNRSTALDARRIFEVTGIDQRRRREKPWRWRRMISRRCSLGNQPVIMESCLNGWHDPKEWHERLGNMRKAFRNAAIHSDSVEQHKIYTIPEFLHINKHRRDTWLRQGIDIHQQPIHRKHDVEPYQELPARYWRRQEQWTMYMFLLDLLPRILSLSGRYEPLVTMCRTKCLASLSRCWRKKSRQARQAIDAYLQRMELEENK